MKKDDTRESMCFAAAAVEEGKAEKLSPAQLDVLMDGEQGTLLVCRTLETAQKMLSKYPQTVFSAGDASDSRAYHTVLLYAMPGPACAPYRHVVLCDGELNESAAWQRACPQGKVYALETTAEIRQLCVRMALDRNMLHPGIGTAGCLSGGGENTVG